MSGVPSWMSELFEQTWTPGLKRDDSTGTWSYDKIYASIILIPPCRRGKSGGQVRDEYREEYDPGRGGYGRAYDEQRQREEEEYGQGR